MADVKEQQPVPQPAAAAAVDAKNPDEHAHVGDTPETERDELRFKAKLTEHCERYDDMCEIMVTLSEKYPNLNSLERNLLSVAFKNATGSRRAAWRSVMSVEEAQFARTQERNANLTSIYRKKVEVELKSYCSRLIDLVNKSLLPKADDPKLKVFWGKMLGDYNRYLTEIASDEEKERYTKLAREAYTEALQTAEKCVNVSDPLRLGLVLNYSVFKCEVEEKTVEACELADKVFNDAVKELDTNKDEEDVKGATMILQLLKDNVALWKAEISKEAEASQTAADQSQGSVPAENTQQAATQPGGDASAAAGQPNKETAK